jgi:DNA polymerase-4
MVEAMDCVNERFGEFTVTYGSLLKNERMVSRVISPAWRPSGIRSIDVS